jgi:hypothetical protein
VARVADPSAPSSTLTRLRVGAGHQWRFAERHRFVDRSRGADQALLILAGHRPLLWPLTLARIARAVPAEIDVCLMTPGVRDSPLEHYAQERGWSYLATSGGHVGVAQNLAIRALPNARWIYKLDEDIFIAPGFFERLRRGYHRAAGEAEFALGFASPVLNVNGFSYVEFLDTLGLRAEYEERFGPARRASDGVPAQRDGEAAVWLWRHGIPVDAVAQRFSERPFAFSVVPHRFSIGAILYERSLWEHMRGFKRLERAPGLGEDEQHLCVECLSRSRVGVVLHDLYAGHFAFGAQMPVMLGAYGARLAEL